MENIFTASKPFIILAKLLGLFPTSFDGPARKGSLKLKCLDILISLFWFVSICYLVFTGVSRTSFYTGSSIILAKIWDVFIKMEYSLYFIEFCYQVSKHKNIVRFLKKIQKSDEKVSFQKLSFSDEIEI